MIIFFLIFCFLNIFFFRKKYIFHPGNSIIIFNFIYVIPYVLLYFFKGIEIFEFISKRNLSQPDEVVTYFILLSTFNLCFFQLGVFIIKEKRKFSKPFRQNLRINKKILKGIVYFTIIISVGVTLYYYNSLGGIVYYLSNIANRSEITLGSGFLFGISQFLIFFSSGFLLVSYKNGIIKKKFVILCFIIFILLLLISGSRSVLMRLIFLNIVIYYYLFNPNIKRLFNLKNSIKFFIFFLVICSYVVLTPILRRSTLQDEINFSDSWSESLDNLEQIVKGNSYTEIQLNILDYFEENDFWYGKTYVDLLSVPLPRSIYPNKPSADDGLYIYNTVAGTNLKISSEDFQNLVIQSWPPSTFGATYANFGIIGLFVGFFVLGILLKLSYVKMISNKESYIYMFLYAYLFWRFQLSNLAILEVVMVFVYIHIINFLSQKYFKIYK